MIWLSGIIAAFSLLAVFQAPTHALWYAAIGVTEWGHWLALVSLAMAIFLWRSARTWRIHSTVAVLAGLLYLTPWVRASALGRRLPGDMEACFGSGAGLRSPLDWRILFRGESLPPVQKNTIVYQKVGSRLSSMDLYRPLRIGRRLPVIVVVHGGSWQSGNRVEFLKMNRYLAGRGYGVAAIDYRLAPGSVFPAQRDDVFSALTYLKAHAAEWRLDTSRFVLLGRSAGGQIALSAAYAAKDASIRGAIVLYAPNDLEWGYRLPANPLIMDSRKVIETYLGASPSESPSAYASASPLGFVNEKTPPTLMVHGARDELVSVLHEERLSSRLEQAHRPYFFLRLPWATHGCDANFNGPSGQLATYAIDRFLQWVMPA